MVVQVKGLLQKSFSLFKKKLYQPKLSITNYPILLKSLPESISHIFKFIYILAICSAKKRTE